jgi:hypothetical protein
MTQPIADGISKTTTASTTTASTTTSRARMAELGMDFFNRHILLMNSVEARGAAVEVDRGHEAWLIPNRHAQREAEAHRPEFPRDAEQFSLGLEDDSNLSGAKLIAGVLSEVALIAMLVTSLQEPDRGWAVWLAVVAAGLGMAMSVQIARHRTDRQLRNQLVKTAPVEPPTDWFR